MGLSKNLIRLFQCIFVLNFVILYFNSASGKTTTGLTTIKPVEDVNATDRIPIGKLIFKRVFFFMIF